MANKSKPSPKPGANGEDANPPTEAARDAFFVSMLQGKLEDQLALIRGPLASHVLPEALDRFDQKRRVFEDVLKFIKTTNPGKQRLEEFVGQQVRLLQGKLSSAAGKDREHLQYQIELYAKILEPPHFGHPESDVFK